MKKSLAIILIAMALTGCGASQTVEPTEAAVIEETTESVEATEAAEDEAEAETEVEEAAEPVETEESSSPYTYTDLSQTLYAQSTVNVRETPEQTGEKLGSLTANQEVTVTGQCNETGWYRISYNGGEGFVSDSYLGTEKVAVKSTTKAPASQSTDTTTSEAPASETNTPSNPNEVDTSNAVTVDRPLEPGETLTPDVWYCGICGFETTSRDEYAAHMVDVEGLLYGN